MTWTSIESVPEYETVALCRRGDLYPVIGAKVGTIYILEEGGAEDGPHRTYPALQWRPTHWRRLPEEWDPPE